MTILWFNFTEIVLWCVIRWAVTLLVHRPLDIRKNGGAWSISESEENLPVPNNHPSVAQHQPTDIQANQI